MEIYLGVKAVIFAQMVGLGPVRDEKFSLELGFKPRTKDLPALITQLTTGEVFSCRFEPDNAVNESAIVFNRNFLLPEDFEPTGMAKGLKLLMQQGIPLRLALGDSWDNERFLTWEKKDESLLKQIPIETAFSLGQGYKIARRLELIHEYEHLEAVCESINKESQKNAPYTTLLKQHEEIKSMISKDLPWLINSETHRSSVGSSTKPDLNFYEGMYD